MEGRVNVTAVWWRKLEGGGRAHGRDRAPPGKVAWGGHLHSRVEAVLGPPPWTLRGVCTWGNPTGEDVRDRDMLTAVTLEEAATKRTLAS